MLVTTRPAGLIMHLMTGLALAGAKPNSSFGDPSFPFLRVAVLAGAIPRRQQRKKIPGREVPQPGVTRLACSQEATPPYVRQIAQAIGKKTRWARALPARRAAKKKPAIAGRRMRIHRALRGTKRPITLPSGRAASNACALPAITDGGLSCRAGLLAWGAESPLSRVVP
jgi:hypothetical protein